MKIKMFVNRFDLICCIHLLYLLCSCRVEGGNCSMTQDNTSDNISSSSRLTRTRLTAVCLTFCLFAFTFHWFSHYPRQQHTLPVNSDDNNRTGRTDNDCCERRRRPDVSCLEQLRKLRITDEEYVAVGRERFKRMLSNDDRRWLKDCRNDARHQQRLLDVPQGTYRLPHCLIIGVRKGGTRALLEFLNLHPDINAVRQEMHFFDDEKRYTRGLDWYRHRMKPSLPRQYLLFLAV